VSRAALFGGTTTLIDFVQCTHDRSIQKAIEETDSIWKNAVWNRPGIISFDNGPKSLDFCFHLCPSR